ncbi:MAG: carbohydrate ABC transporter permease, partial [Acutalibacteraceae bacterium]
NSIIISVLGTIVYIFIASLAAYPLAKGKFIGATVISNLVVWTMLFRGEVTAIPQYLVISSLGLVDTYAAIILPSLAGTMGVFLMQQFMVSSIPDSVLEAARIDGANEYTIVFRIVFPCVKPGWLTLAIFTFQGLWGNSGGQYIYTENLKPLPNVLSQISAGGFARAGAASAVAVLLMIPPIILFIFSQSSIMETMSHSGLK